MAVSPPTRTWITRNGPTERRRDFLSSSWPLGDYGANKQLALIFGFNVLYSSLPGRVLVYTDASKDLAATWSDIGDGNIERVIPFDEANRKL
jgi:hypothetical protein